MAPRASPSSCSPARSTDLGSSRDWAGKGPKLLGVRAVIAESFERIHRSNLIGMGVLPLQFRDGENVDSLGLTGRELFDVEGVAGLDTAALVGRQLDVTARDGDSGVLRRFTAQLRIDTPTEADYFAAGGILLYVARQLARA